MESVLQYESVRNWLLGLGKTTQENYPLWLRRFCEYAGRDPDQLLGDCRRDALQVHGTMKQFYESLVGQGLSSHSRYNAYITVRSFFRHNDLQFGKIPPRFLARTEHEKGRLLQRQEVFDMISCSWTVRNKAIISFLAQTGQRAGVLCALRIGHVRQELERGIAPVVVDVNAGLLDFHGWSANKGGIRYRFAVGRECADYLRQMIRQRKAAREPLDDDSWLFRSNVKRVRHPSGSTFPVKTKMSERGAPLTGAAICLIVDKGATDAGIQSKQVVGRKVDGVPKVAFEIHPHIFRLFWKSAMRRGGVKDPDLLSFMMGPKRGYRQTYDRFEPDYVRSEYAKAEPYLSVMSFPSEKSTFAPGQITSSLNPVESALGNSPQRPKSPSCQRVTTEPELESYLSNGWHFVATLPSGRLIVETGTE